MKLGDGQTGRVEVSFDWLLQRGIQTFARFKRSNATSTYPCLNAELRAVKKSSRRPCVRDAGYEESKGQMAYLYQLMRCALRAQGSSSHLEIAKTIYEISTQLDMYAGYE
jgi:hypothetical protein